VLDHEACIDAGLVHVMQASASPSEQPKVNTTASEYYVLQYSVRLCIVPAVQQLP
jgi:hypothetical protein